MRNAREQALPRSITALRTARKTLAACAVFAVLLGFCASLDSLVATLRTPADLARLIPGSETVISGSISVSRNPPNVMLRVEPATDRVIVSPISYSQGFFSDDLSWRAVITALPSAVPGNYTVSAHLNGPAAHLPSSHWKLEILPHEEALREASRSLFVRWFDAEPLEIAIRSLCLAIASGVLYLLLFYFGSRILARHGYFRVYYARPEGDDTMLYCIDQETLLAENQSYPVLSAAGQLLGLAEVEDRGARHCVLKLVAAQARAGCYIALSIRSDEPGPDEP